MKRTLLSLSLCAVVILGAGSGVGSRALPVQAPASGLPTEGQPVLAGSSPAVAALPPPARAAVSAEPYRLQIEPGIPRRGVRAPAFAQADGAVQGAPSAPLMPAPLLTFDGNTAADNTTAFGFTVAPPDTTGDVGPNHFVQFVNLLARVFNKTGAPLTAPFKVSSLFASIGGICAGNDNGDPQALYDPIANRWVLAQFAFTGLHSPPYHMCIAVSKTADPTGAYWVYDFLTPGSEFPDYPKLGVWPDGYYMTVNQFLSGNNFDGTGAYAFNRSKMLVGDPTANFIYFNLNLSSHPEGIGGALPSDLDGTNLPAAGAPNVFSYFTADEFSDPFDGLRLFNFHADFVTPANSTFIERPESPVATAAFSPLVSNIPQAGSASTLDVLSDRLMHRLQYRNLGANECLTTNHTVNNGGTAAVRWHVLCKSGSGPYSLAAPGGEGTFSPDSTHRWMGSAALDKQGNLAVGYSASSTVLNPQLRYAGRLASDPAGVLAQGEAHLFDGTGSQLNTSSRWGDYSMLAVDPSDDCTFWYTSEYYATTSQFNWRTRIGKFVFPSCTGGGANPPDLVVSALSAPAKSAAGATFNVKDTTANTGAGSAPATVTRVYFSTNNVLDGGDTVLGSRVVPALSPSTTSVGTTSVTIPAATTPGVYWLITQADATALATESNEGNNTRAKKIRIGPDLTVAALSGPSTAARGSSIVISDTTKNTGGAPTVVNTVTRLYLSTDKIVGGGDVVLGSRTIPPLAVNGTSVGNTTVTIPTSTAPGPYYIIAVSDATSLVAESSETNNKRVFGLIQINP